MKNWLLAIGTYGIGDFVTTVIGLSLHGVYEANPTANAVLGTVGFLGIILAKIVVFVSVYGIGRTMPEHARKYGPYTLTVIGSAIVLWNSSVILKAIF